MHRRWVFRFKRVLRAFNLAADCRQAYVTGFFTSKLRVTVPRIVSSSSRASCMVKHGSVFVTPCSFCPAYVKPFAVTRILTGFRTAVRCN
jgi:hypothetical protein